jgi:cyclic pyranopterin phosphate synthase
MVVIKGFNDDEIVDFALMSKTKPYHVRYIEYMPFNTQEGWQRRVPHSQTVKENDRRGRAARPGDQNQRLHGPGPAFQVWDAPGSRFHKPVSEHFCGTCNRLRLTSTESYAPAVLR